MKFVLVRLQISKCGELFPTIIETAGVRLWIVNYLVGANIAFLGEPLAADFTLEWPFTGVPPFVCLLSFRAERSFSHNQAPYTGRALLQYVLVRGSLGVSFD